MSRVLITGGKGMLGRALHERPPEAWTARFVDLDEVDVADRAAVQAAFRDVAPEVVIHCAAMTDVDGCETDPAAAQRVNVEGTGNVATACADRAHMVYISTDFVFDGQKTEPYVETDPPAPLSVYGRTKLQGEERVRELVPHHAIVRTAWTFAPWGHNFVRSILKAARERGHLRVVTDQVGSPTYAPDLANALCNLVERRATGTYHVTNAGIVSRFEFAREIVAAAGMADIPVEPIASANLGQPARRPAYSPLAGTGTPPLRHYREALADCIAAIAANGA